MKMSDKPYEEAIVIMHGPFTPNKELVKTLLKKSEETQGQRTMKTSKERKSKWVQ